MTFIALQQRATAIITFVVAESAERGARRKAERRLVALAPPDRHGEELSVKSDADAILNTRAEIQRRSLIFAVNSRAQSRVERPKSRETGKSSLRQRQVTPCE